MRTFLVQAAHEVVSIVGEEALVVQRVADQLRHGCHAHGLAVAVLVHDVLELQRLLQLLAIRLEVGGGDHALVRPAETICLTGKRKGTKLMVQMLRPTYVIDMSVVRPGAMSCAARKPKERTFL